MSRYKVVFGSPSAHCCFEAAVVDTTRPILINGKPWVEKGEPSYETMCECFDEVSAHAICAALNMAERTAST